MITENHFLKDIKAQTYLYQYKRKKKRHPFSLILKLLSNKEQNKNSRALKMTKALE